MTTTSSRNNKRPAKPRPRGGSSRRRKGRGSTNMFLWIFLGVLVVLFVGIAIVSRSGVGGTEITDAQASGDALPKYAQGVDGAVGATAPEFSGQTLDGESITVTPGDGAPKAIAFLAHWCPHCQREMPTVVDWVADGRLPEGVELIGVASGNDRTQPNFPPQDWFEREEWPGQTVLDGDNAVANSYGLANYPYWVLVDGDGKVVQRWSGETTPDQLDERIGKLAQ